MSARRCHLEDVDLLLRSGESPDRIASRLGVKVGSLARNLHRHGYTDAARIFWRIDARNRRAAA